MDGLSTAFAPPLDQASLRAGIISSGVDDAGWLKTARPAQRTVRNTIGCVGVGLHSGRKVALTLGPAPAGAGIVFRRIDVEAGTGGVAIPARFDLVAEGRLCTTLAAPGRPDVRIGTVEHVMAALAGCGIHNAVITVDGPEVPIFDGSAASFVFLIDCAGIVEQDEPVPAIEILRAVTVSEGEASASFVPGGTSSGLDMTVSIAFDAPAIGRQSASVALSPDSFRNALARARTFTLASEVAALRAAGLARGGSLDNAVVVDGAQVLNPGGLRMADEFVRHKLLDAVGDLALAGVALRGRFVGRRSGHALNNRLLRALFADDANWAPVTQSPASAAWHDALPSAA